MSETEATFTVTVPTTLYIARAKRKDWGLHTGCTLRILATLVDEDGTVVDADSATEAVFVLKLAEGHVRKTLANGGIVKDTTDPDGKTRLRIDIMPANTVGVAAQIPEYEFIVSFTDDRAPSLYGYFRITKSDAEPDETWDPNAIDDEGMAAA